MPDLMLLIFRLKTNIAKLGKNRLKALHLHDVDGINDSHTIPYYGIVRWDKVTSGLKKVGYDGDFTFETSYVFTPDCPYKLLQSTINHLADTGRCLIKKLQIIEIYKEILHKI